MTAAQGLKSIESRIAYCFVDPSLLERALTHCSVSGTGDNERLEFLGDSVVNLYVARQLYDRYPRAEEGELSRMRASLVRESSLADIARELNLGDHLQMGEGEMKSGGWRRSSVLADALEAIVAAVYLDGGHASAESVCDQLFTGPIDKVPDAESLKDAKTRLQEWLQARQRPLPSYSVIDSSGPPHKRIFKVLASLEDDSLEIRAEGNSRRSAEQEAAERMLHSLMSTTP